MKFETRKEAENWRSIQPFPYRHKVIKDKYMDLSTFTFVACWTVVYT